MQPLSPSSSAVFNKKAVATFVDRIVSQAPAWLQTRLWLHGETSIARINKTSDALTLFSELLRC